MRFLSQRGFTLIELIIVLVVIVGGIWLYSAIWGGDDEAEKKISTQPLESHVASTLPPPVPLPVVKPNPQKEPSVVSEGWNMKNARHIAVNDRRWSAALLYEISPKLFVKKGVLNYHRLMINIDNQAYAKYCGFLTSFKDDINMREVVRKMVLKMEKHHNHEEINKELNKERKNLCEESGIGIEIYWSSTIKVEKQLTHIFDKSIFNAVIADADITNLGFGLWLYNVGQHEPLFKAVKLLLEQYHDLAERLTVLHEGRAKIIKEYGKGSNVKALDSDIKKLSALGWELTKVTGRFFVAIKPRMVKLEVAATRQQALAGLRTFENEIDSAQTTSSQSLDDIIANIDQAVRKLERAINQ